MDKSLDGSEEKDIFPDEESKKACAKALKLLLHKDRTKEELSKKLLEAGFSVKSVEFALEYASGYGYLDDASYAAKYVEYKKTTRSKKEIIYKLKEKGVSEADYEEALMGYTKKDEIYAAAMLLKKRLKGADFSELDYEEQAKHKAYLGRKGYPLDVISKAVKLL